MFLISAKHDEIRRQLELAQFAESKRCEEKAADEATIKSLHEKVEVLKRALEAERQREVGNVRQTEVHFVGWLNETKSILVRELERHAQDHATFLLRS